MRHSASVAAWHSISGWIDKNAAAPVLSCGISSIEMPSKSNSVRFRKSVAVCPALVGGPKKFSGMIGSSLRLARVTRTLRQGHASLPHGYGHVFDTPIGSVTIRLRLNALTGCDDSDPIAKTPYRKNVAIRIERAAPLEVAAMKENVTRVLAMA